VPYLLILFPLAMAALTWLTPGNARRPRLLPIGGAVHLGLALWAILRPEDAGDAAGHGDWLRLDALGKIVLGLTAAVFFLCSLYAPAYLALRADRSNRVFCSMLFVAPAMMTLVTLCRHLGLLWVAMEAMTLSCAPLLFFNRSPRSLEAVWKYLLIGSVGIALALLGSFFLAYASLKAGLESTLLLDRLVQDAPRLSAPWLHAAFVLLLVGYGTKMGLAPMHTWKPDAYGEAPGLVATLLAGGAASCAFLAVLRVFQVCRAGPGGAAAAQMMIFLGLLSMATAAVFIVGQRDFKRMLAYSSVEHMGVLVLGAGLGGAALYGAILHLISNALTKGAMFLSAANIQRAFGTKSAGDVCGAVKRLPVSGVLFLVGFLAITGAPPFGPFISEFTIAAAALSGGRFVVGALFLLFLAIVFVGMGAVVLPMVQGDPPTEPRDGRFADRFGTVAPALLFVGLAAVLGVCVPPPLDDLLRRAAALVEGRP
jgi:hydrogenase-4 component F